MPIKYFSSIIPGFQYLFSILLPFLALNLLLTVPSWFAWYQQFHVAHARLQWSVFALVWLSLDLLLLTLVLFVTRTATFHSWVLPVCVGFYLILWIYEIYSKMILVLAHRKPLLYNDIFLINDAVYLFADLLKSYWQILTVSVVLFVLCAGWLIPMLFRAMDAGLQQLPAHLSGFWISLTVLAGLVGFHQVKHSRLPDAPGQLIAGRLRMNLQRSVSLYKQVHTPEFITIFRQQMDKPLPRLTDTPNVYFFLIESYGSVLTDRPQLRTQYHRLLLEFQDAISETGWRTVTGSSEAPISGSGSWLSTASILSGTRIANQATFDYLTSSFTPPLVRFFRENGYTTVILEPASRARPGLPLYNQYHFDLVLSLKDLAFENFPQFGWGLVPDQYSLAVTEARWLQGMTGPVFLYFPMVSSHAPWTPATIPPLLETDTEEQDFRTTYKRYVADGPPARNASGSKTNTGFAEMYLAAIRYDLRVIADFLHHHASEKNLVVIMGDHQPPLITSDQDTYHTPVHILSRDATTLTPFKSAGFVSGLTGASPETMIAHHTMTPLIMAALSGASERTTAP